MLLLLRKTQQQCIIFLVLYIIIVSNQMSVCCYIILLMLLSQVVDANMEHTNGNSARFGDQIARYSAGGSALSDGAHINSTNTAVFPGRDLPCFLPLILSFHKTIMHRRFCILSCIYLSWTSCYTIKLFFIYSYVQLVLFLFMPVVLYYYVMSLLFSFKFEPGGIYAVLIQVTLSFLTIFVKALAIQL